MKKLFALLLTLAMLFSLTACSSGEENTPSANGQQTRPASVPQNADEALEDLEEMMEFLKPEGWDENKFNAYIYDVMLEIGFSDTIENLQY